MLPLPCSVRESRKSHVIFPSFFFPPFPFPSLPFRSSLFLFFFIFFSFFYSFPSTRFPLYLSRQPLAIRSPQGKLVFSIARRRAGTKTRGNTGSQVEATFFSKQEPRLYSRGMQVRRLIAKEEQFVDPSPALNCFPFFAESFTRYTVRRPGFLRISRLKIAHANIYIFSSFVRSR